MLSIPLYFSDFTEIGVRMPRHRRFFLFFDYYKLKSRSGTIPKSEKGVIFMDIRSRILKGRLIDRISRDPAYCEKLGLRDLSGFRSGPAEAPIPPEPDPQPDLAPDAPQDAEHK